MYQESFDRQVQDASRRIVALQRRARLESAHEPEILVSALEELQTTMEELLVAQEELRQQNEALQAAHLEAEVERQRYQDLFEFAPDGYLATDPAGIIQEANRAAAQMLEASQKYLFHRPLAVLIADEDRRTFRRELARLVQGGPARRWEIRLKPKKRLPFHAALTVAPIQDPKGAVIGLRWMVRDITERKQTEEAVLAWNRDLEQRVQARTAELEAANAAAHREIEERKRIEEELAANQRQLAALNERLKRAMVETHHRVKNNLQALASMVDMLAMDEAPTIPMTELHRLNSYIRTLATIHDILTQQAKEDERATHIHAEAMLERLLPLMRQSAGKPGLKAELEDALLTVRQGTSLAIIVNELVSNAIKHGDGTITLKFHRTDGEAELEITDEGAGFPEGFDGKLAARTGLELVEHLTRYDLGGHIHYANRPEGGGRVILTFPL
ncbi:MAG TPA: PAS domain-containing protein [Chthonomonadaceae bacterium]|nr:PAS domain-containing protein [Chthonomonadaceae bacterium]